MTNTQTPADNAPSSSDEVFPVEAAEEQLKKAALEGAANKWKGGKKDVDALTAAADALLAAQASAATYLAQLEDGTWTAGPVSINKLRAYAPGLVVAVYPYTDNVFEPTITDPVEIAELLR